MNSHQRQLLTTGNWGNSAIKRLSLLDRNFATLQAQKWCMARDSSLLNGTQFPVARYNSCKQTTSPIMYIFFFYKDKANNIQWHTALIYEKETPSLVIGLLDDCKSATQQFRGKQPSRFRRWAFYLGKAGVTLLACYKLKHLRIRPRLVRPC